MDCAMKSLLIFLDCMHKIYLYKDIYCQALVPNPYVPNPPRPNPNPVQPSSNPNKPKRGLGLTL